jgi:hypothetical protein
MKFELPPEKGMRDGPNRGVTVHCRFQFAKVRLVRGASRRVQAGATSRRRRTWYVFPPVRPRSCLPGGSMVPVDARPGVSPAGSRVDGAGLSPWQCDD